MSIKKEIREGNLIPAWYGVAWTEYREGSLYGHCLPIPLNLIAGWARRLYLWVKHGGNGFRHQFSTSRPDLLDTSGG
ncbi:hypothetical protein WIX39_026240 [Variovorax sp. AB1(2024)]|uniref:hypothetical protein n=1 Tax=Variovorax sp. AB1(2024) TaxID=3132214 RepID=UPI0030A1963E